MEAIGETCKLCLKYIQGANLAALDETLLGKLEFLQMNLDQSVEESNSVCKECEEKIEQAFDFKSCLVNTESCLVPYVSEDKTQKVNLRVVVEKDSPSTSVGESSAEKEVCRLCKNFVNAISVISLPKILKDECMLEVFQGHIPEMDLEVTENPVVCDTCQTSLASFSTLIASWSIANGWNDDEDDEDMKEEFGNYEVIPMKKEDVDLTDSNTNSSTSLMDISASAKKTKNNKSNNKTAKVKSEGGEISDSSECASNISKDIKKEDCEDEDDESMDVQLKSEEVDIKPEDEDGTINANNTFSESYQAYIDQIKSLAYATDLGPPFDCKNCNYKVKCKKNLINHMIVNNHLEQLTDTKITGIPLAPHKCSKCPFQGKNSMSLAHHLIIHKRPERPEFYKCDVCSYQSKKLYTLKRHQLTHKDPKEVETFKCSLCTFESIHKQSLRDHVVIHKDTSEVKLFKCHLCPYETNRRLGLRHHRQRIHEIGLPSTKHIPGNHNIYKCASCCFGTNKKNSLVKHMLVHKRMNEVPTFKCQKCDYESKHKCALNRHVRKHRTYDEIVSFQCTECSFRSKFQCNMLKHMSLHQRGDHKDVLKCKYCSYTSKSMGSLGNHVKRIHNVQYHEEKRQFGKVTAN